jgi:hypothetical protein
MNNVCLIIGVINILLAAAGGTFSQVNFIVGLLCLFTGFGGFGPYSKE